MSRTAKTSTKTTTAIPVYTVLGAQYSASDGELIPFGGPYGTLEEAAKFVVRDYNKSCKAYNDPNTLSRDAWKGLMVTRVIESPSDWPAWTKWTIVRQKLVLGK